MSNSIGGYQPSGSAEDAEKALKNPPQGGSSVSKE